MFIQPLIGKLAGTICAITLALGVAQAGQAALQSYGEDFESYDLTTGSTDRFRDQNEAWTSAPASVDVATDAIYDDNTLVNGSQVLRLSHEDGTKARGIRNGGVTEDGMSGEIQIGFDAYVENGHFLAWFIESSSAGVQIRFDDNGVRVRQAGGSYALIVDGDSNEVTTYDTNKWYRVALDLFIVDPDDPEHTGVSKFSMSVTNLSDNVEVGSVNDLDLYGNASLLNTIHLQTWGATGENGGTTRYDNLFMNEVPEPASLVLLSLGTLLTLGKRHRSTNH